MQRILVIGIILSLTLTASSGTAQEKKEPLTQTVESDVESDVESSEESTLAFGFDFFPFVGTSTFAPTRRRTLSWNFAGLSGGTDILEVSSMFSLSTGSVYGVQFSGMFNYVGGDIGALQVASGANWVAGAGSGVQMATMGNVTRGDFRGLQLAGNLNFTGGDVTGVQLAPVNISLGDVRGMQVGVINLARSASVSIGIINFYWGGFLNAEVFGSDDGLLMAGIRTGSGPIYNTYSIGTRLFAAGPTPLASGLGLGWRSDIGEDAEFSLDATLTNILVNDRRGQWNARLNLVKLRPMMSASISDNMHLFGGPTATLMVAFNDINPAEYGHFATWELTDPDASTTLALWPGLVVGARFF